MALSAAIFLAQVKAQFQPSGDISELKLIPNPL